MEIPRRFRKKVRLLILGRADRILTKTTRDALLKLLMEFRSRA